VLPAGTIVQSSLKVVNGFRFVQHNNQSGYIADSLLETMTHNPAPATKTATTYLNLRAEPSLSGKILMVLPPFQIVTDLGESRNGFRKVAFQNTQGWASESFLR
jgi:SH3-like domain-containing protein